MLDNRELREKVEAHALAMARFLAADRDFEEGRSQWTHDQREAALAELTTATRAIIYHTEEWGQ